MTRIRATFSVAARMLKVREALKAALVLSRDPFEFESLNRMVDACSLSWPVQAWYRRLLAGVPQDKIDHLRELTRRPLDIAALEKLPENTFGHRYAKFFEEHAIAAGGHTQAIPALWETFEKDWVTHRFFKIHDILHALVGFGTTVPAEMGLQMFDFVNLREPYGGLAVLSTPYMMLHYGQPVEMLREIARGYALGRRTRNLFFAPLEEMWAMDFDEARRALGLADLPPPS